MQIHLERVTVWLYPPLSAVTHSIGAIAGNKHKTLMIPATIVQARSSTGQPAVSDEFSFSLDDRWQQIIEEVKRCRNPKKNTTKTNINPKVQSFNQKQHLPLQPKGNETPWWILGPRCLGAQPKWRHSSHLFGHVNHGTFSQSFTIKARMTTLWHPAWGRGSSGAPPPAPLALCDGSSLSVGWIAPVLSWLRLASSVGSVITPLVFNSPECFFFFLFFHFYWRVNKLWTAMWNIQYGVTVHYHRRYSLGVSALHRDGEVRRYQQENTNICLP